MSQFKFLARRKDGSQVDGWVQANSQEEAKRILAERQLSVMFVKKGEKVSVSGRRIKRESLMTSLRELATLRESGMSLDNAVGILTDTTDDKQTKQVFKRIYEDISSGQSLSESVAGQPDAFPFYVSSMLLLGESNGNLADALISIADRMEKEENLTSEIKTALTYPTFLLIICVVVLLFLFTYVIPNFESMLTDANRDGPLGTLLSVSHFVTSKIYFILAFFAFLGWWLVNSIRTGKIYDFGLRTLSRLPYLRDLVMSWQIVQFSSSMHKLIESGVDLVDAVSITNNNIANNELNKKITLVISRVKEGKGLGESLDEYHVFPKIVIRLINTGEAGASLIPCFREITKLYERRLSKGIKQILSVLEPGVIVVMGGIVGAIMIVLISGIISVNDIGW